MLLVTLLLISAFISVDLSLADEIGEHETSEGTCIGGIQMSLTNATGDIYAVAFSQDGKYLATGSFDKNVYIYDTSDWSLERTLGGTDLIYSVAFSYDNKWFAYGDYYGNCSVYNRTDWSLEEVLTPGPAGGLWADSIDFSQNGDYIAFAANSDFDSNDHVYAHNTSDWARVATLDEGESHDIDSVSFSPDSNNIAYGGYGDSNVYVYKTSDWSINATLIDATDSILSVAFSQDNEYIAYGGLDDRVYVNKVSDWSFYGTLYESTELVRSVAFSPDNKYIIYAGADSKVYIHNFSDGSLETTLTEATGIITSVDFSPDSNIIAYGAWDDITHIFNIFNVTRTIGDVGDEQDELSFTPSYNYSMNVTYKVPVSTSVKGIVGVRNNTGGIQATEVNTSDELINNTFWYDAASQFVYIGTVNLTTSTIVNWTVNCSYGVNFNLIIPPFLEVGQYFHSEGFISDSDGNAISGMIAETRLLYANGTDALSVNPKHNCTGGNYKCTFSTAVLPPGVYSVSIEFTDPTSGIVFKEGGTLFLSFATPDGVYSNAIVYFSFYNTNIGLGLIPETFKVYVNDVRNYLNVHYGYTGEVINITIRDYYDFVMYSSNYTITKTYTGLNFGLTFHEYDFTNANDEYFYASFLKDGATRWYERVVSSSGGQKSFMLPTGNYTVRVYNADNSTYLSWTETINRSKAYLIGTDGVSLIIQGQSVIIGEFLELREELAYAFMPDVTIISRNPPMIFSVYDKEGMAFGNDFYMICPPLITIATTRVTQYGNWINSTPMVPGNGSILNGTITIINDVLHISGPGSITWVNITNADNGTLFQNTSYIPSRVDIYGQNLSINASGNISVLRVTKFNQERKFDWTYYPFSGYGPDLDRAGWHSAGIEIINVLDVPLYDVYAIAVFSPESNPDGSSVEVKDTTNGGVILERGPNYDVTDTSIHFNIQAGMAANETRAFTIGYYKMQQESYIYDEGTVSIPTYDITTYDGKSYNTFPVHWSNPHSETFRGALYIKLNFDVPVGIDTTSMRVYDLTNDHELDPIGFIPGDKYIRISADTIGSVLPGGSRKFDVYFLMEVYPGADPKELHLDTEIFMGITPFLIILLLGVAFIILGAYFASSDKKDRKDRWKVCVALGIFLVVVIYIMNMMGL